MGKRGGHKSGRGRAAGQRSVERTDYRDIVKENELFERYYNDLGLVPAEERETFWAVLRRELPSSFRFAGSKRYGFFKDRPPHS